VVQENSYYPFGAPINDLSWSPKSTNRYLREGKEYISDFDWNKHDFTGRTFDSWTLRALQVDPMAGKYYENSPYALWLGNPLRVIDPDGRDIVLINAYKTNNRGNYDAKRGVSAITQSALIDLMKTKEVREFFGLFAKEGDIIGDYTFTENGQLSDKTLTLNDYSFEEGYDSNLPLGIEGSISVNESGVTVKVVSYGENKANVGEILTHETQLHGYKIESEMKRENVTSAGQDHQALKSQDKSHKGYQKYDSTRKELETIDNNYKKSFEEAEEHAKRMY
jgi:RHS repeat-associated protein